MIELNVSDIESIFVEPDRILFIKSTPLGVLVALNIGMPTPYPIEVTNTAQDIMEAIEVERALMWAPLVGETG